MNDPVLTRLSELQAEAPPPHLSQKLRSLAHARLVPRKVHPLWSLAVAASVCVYLGWALQFTSRIY